MLVALATHTQTIHRGGGAPHTVQAGKCVYESVQRGVCVYGGAPPFFFFFLVPFLAVPPLKGLVFRGQLEGLRHWARAPKSEEAG